MFQNQPRCVPVVSKTGKPLMPCHPVRARKLINKGKAIKKFRRGFFYIQLTEREDGDIQPVVIGIDPGSMREAYTVMSPKRTFINIQTHAADGKGIKKSMEGRGNARRARRGRKTPCRQPRWSNRKRKENWLPPSTKARWQRKLNMILFLSRLYPVTDIAIEDVSMPSKEGDKKYNASFSPLIAGKNWLYSRLSLLNLTVSKYRGLETASYRTKLGLTKTKHKLSNSFSAHCVDSWVLANETIAGRTYVDLTSVVALVHHKLTRRQLHRFNPSKGGKRSRYGGTISLGIKKGTVCYWKNRGLYYIGGTDGKESLSLHSPITGTRVTRSAKPQDVRIVSYYPWRFIDYGVCNLPKKEKTVMRLNKLSLKLASLGIPDSRVYRALKSGYMFNQ